MSALIPMEKLSEAFEWDERAHELRRTKHKMRERGEISIEIRHNPGAETILLEDAPFVFDALDRYFDGIIEELERDIRALSIEPTTFTPPPSTEGCR